MKGAVLLILAGVLLAMADPLPGCQIYNENSCNGDQIITPDTFENHRWVTPPRTDANWIPSFQDYSELVAHAHVVYSDTSRTSATVELIVLQRDPASGGALTYIFDGQSQAISVAKFDHTFTKVLSLAVTDAAGNRIDLEPVDFVWNAPAIPALSGDYRNGQKGALVEFFGWPHADVEKECSALAHYGYLGARLFPVHEQVMSYQPFNNVMNPWYFMYQPVSYRLQGRMGTRDQLRSLIRTCRSLGVRVYADAVVNHMVGCGNDANTLHRTSSGGSCTTWPNKTSSLPGGHSPMWSQCFAYITNPRTGQPPSQEFPAVPYGPTDFHCNRALNSWTSPLILNAGWLSGLVDLNTEKDNVQERIADYMTDLIGIGFSGFRVDAAKHIQPDDLAGIFAKVQRNLGGALPDDFISWLEVLLGGESSLLMCNPSSGYNFGAYFENKLKAVGLSTVDVNKIKIWNSGYPKETDNGACTISKVRNVIQNDDHDQQNPGSSSRDMGDQGCVLIKGCTVANHRAFEVKLFQNPNGISDNANEAPIRAVLSSYYWAGGSQGVPDGQSLCSSCTTTCGGCQDTPFIQAYSAGSTGYDSTGYTRVHRDLAIVNAMRAWMGLPAISN